MFAESVDEEEIIARVAALDIGKAELVCCVRVPAAGGAKRRLQEVSTHSTMTRSLGELANRLVDLRVERVVMEATATTGSRCSTCWRPMAWSRGWSTPATSGICRDDRRPTCWMRCGCARSPSVRCCDPVSCRRARSVGCGT